MNGEISTRATTTLHPPKDAFISTPRETSYTNLNPFSALLLARTLEAQKFLPSLLSFILLDFAHYKKNAKLYYPMLMSLTLERILICECHKNNLVKFQYKPCKNVAESSRILS